MRDYGEVANLFKALGDASRLKILDLLAAGPLNAGSLQSKTGIGQSTLSYHMNILCQAGLVLCQKQGRNMIYSLSGDSAKAARKWLKALGKAG